VKTSKYIPLHESNSVETPDQR